MGREFDLVQGELALSLQQQGGASGTREGWIRLEKVVVGEPGAATAAGFEGRVVSIHPEWQFIVVDLGWDAVTIGDVVSIYRGEQFLAKARVDRVQEAVCAATVLPEWQQAVLQVNDAVRPL